MNLWHDISESRIKSDDFEVLIEIPKGGKVKYELDKQTGALRLDRVLYTSTVYPANYGFIPRTLAEDNDPLDALVLCSEAIFPMTLVKCKPIGVLLMTDGGRRDEKVIAVPFGDPTYSGYNEVSELPSHVIEEMTHFFEVYKALEGKETAVQSILGASEAKSVVKNCISAYAKCK